MENQFKKPKKNYDTDCVQAEYGYGGALEIAQMLHTDPVPLLRKVQEGSDINDLTITDIKKQV